ncbi:MAG: extracellular solute-binding protein, partial [bacterium]|nr:extracellular solute-binding protein [bacterium]
MITWSRQIVFCLGVLLAIPGCAKKEEVPLTIWWAQWDPADGLQELGNRFERETGIAVKVHQIPWPSYQDQVFLNFGNNQTDFDIVIGDSQWIGRGATKGLYVDLTDWLPTAVDMT